MAYALEGRRVIAGVLAVAATSVLLWFGTGLHPCWPLVWLAPIPVLVFALQASWRGAALATGLAWFLGGLNLGHYFYLLNTPAAVWCMIFLVRAVVFAGAVLLYRGLVRRGAAWSALLALPAAWVVWEYVLNLGSPHGTAMNLAYTQLRFVPFLQVASVTGPWGMSFLLLLFPAGIAMGLHYRARAPKQAARVTGVSVGLIVLVLVCGAIRLAWPLTGERVRVGLVASDASDSAGVAREGAATEHRLQAYATQVKLLAARGAKVIVLPEHLGTVSAGTVTSADEIFQSIADKASVTIVVGLAYEAGMQQYNEARVYAPGVAVHSYAKHHLLPPFESMFTPGRAMLTWPEGSGTWGVEICKDMDFTGLSRAYGRAGAGLLLVRRWDFQVDRFWHGHMAVMRSVEDGFSLVRAARGGYLTVTDDRGRILAETPSDAAPFATLMAEVPAVHDTTLYELWGNWFAWVAMAMLLIALVEVFWLRGEMGGLA